MEFLDEWRNSVKEPDSMLNLSKNFRNDGDPWDPHPRSIDGGALDGGETYSYCIDEMKALVGVTWKICIYN